MSKQAANAKTNTTSTTTSAKSFFSADRSQVSNKDEKTSFFRPKAPQTVQTKCSECESDNGKTKSTEEHSASSVIQRNSSIENGDENAATDTLQRTLSVHAPSVAPVQAKLTVGKPDDPLEREADAVADQVVRRSNVPKQLELDPDLNRSVPLTQLKEVNAKQRNTDFVPDHAAHVIEKSGDGVPLKSNIRGTLESSMGLDLESVRVHQNVSSAKAASQLNARAFANRNHIWLGSGESSSDIRLMAHEVTHSAQQGAVGPIRSGIQTPQAINRVSNSIVSRDGGEETQGDASVDVIIEALDGITTANDSAIILAQFQNQGADRMRSILRGLRARASQFDMTEEGMIDWLFSDMTAEDSMTLRGILIRSGVQNEINRIIIDELYSRLSGYTSEADSQEIYSLLAQYTGGGLDRLLDGLAARAEMDGRALGNWLFDDLDRVNAEQVRVHFLTYGALSAPEFASEFTAAKVESLLAGYTGHADSFSILRNFWDSPERARPSIQTKLEAKTQTRWGQSASEALMEDMQKIDYDSLYALTGVNIEKYNYTPSWYEKVISAGEWVDIVAEWIVCGLVGVGTGALGVVWDLVAVLADVVIAAWHLVWWLAYMLTGGAVGSENCLKVKQFVSGIGQIFTDFETVWKLHWELLELEFKTIEGPLTECRRAEFFMRKLAGALINLALIVLAGYGIYKTGLSAIETLQGVSRLRLLAGGVGNAVRLIRLGGSGAESVSLLETMLASRKVLSVGELEGLLKHARIAGNVVEANNLLGSSKVASIGELTTLLDSQKIANVIELEALLKNSKISNAIELQTLLENSKIENAAQLDGILTGVNDVRQLNQLLSLVENGEQLARFQAAVGDPAEIARLIQLAGPSVGDASSLDRVLKRMGSGPMPIAEIERELAAQKILDSKILFGEPQAATPPGTAPVGPMQRGLRGAHSPSVLSSPEFDIITKVINADGTISVKLRKLLFIDSSGNKTWSSPKRSTLAPATWTERDILAAGDEVAGKPSVSGPRTWGSGDGAFMHRYSVRGVQWEVVKDGSGKVTSSYPTGGIASPVHF